MQTHLKIQNRLTELFEKKSGNLLNIYFTAGFPALEDTTIILKALQDAGADMIEIGMPFSDPLADGPTIQQSSEAALENGMSIKKLFAQLKDLRSEITLPIILMGYLNPVMQYGIENFCKSCAEVSIDGIILPDLPFDEFNEFYAPYFEAHQLSNIFLVTPETSPRRLAQIDDSASGFIYAVSTNSTTGASSKDISSAATYFQKLKDADLKNPLMIGFNIHDKQTFDFACQYAKGAIIGSAFIKAIKDSKNLTYDINNFVKNIKGQ